MCAAALGVAGCGDDEGEKGPTEVLIEADQGPKGLAALRGPDRASGSQNERVPITTGGTPTAIYAVELKGLEEGMRVGAIATVTLTKCRVTDYIPNARSFTACEGTRVYDFNPVSVSSGFRLVGGKGSPDLSAAARPSATRSRRAAPPRSTTAPSPSRGSPSSPPPTSPTAAPGGWSTR